MKRIAAFAIVCATAAAQNWPQFRGVRASGIAEGHALPEKWDASAIRWKTPVPGIAVSSPIVWGDKVFVTTAISSDPAAKLRHGLFGDVEPSNDVSKHQWKVYALSKRDGKVLWERTAHEGVPKTKRHPKSSQASCTPVTNGRVLVVNFGSEGLFAYDLNGKLLWKQDLGKLNAGWFFDPDYEWGVASSPVIYKNTVIVQADIQKDSFVAAFDLDSGKQVWRTMRDEIPSWATPAIYEGAPRDELITHATKFIRGYDPGTGKELWRLAGNSEITTPTPLIANGLIYVTNGYRGIQPIYAIRPGASGDISLKGEESANASIAWSHKRGGPYTPTPLILNGLMYILSNQGVLSAYNATSGERLYQQRVGNGGSYSASVVGGDGKIYLSSEDGEINVVKAGPKYELLAQNNVGEVVMATPAISDGMLLIRTMQHVMAVAAPAAK